VCSENMFSAADGSQPGDPALAETPPRPQGVAHVLDSYILPDDTVGCSDHCPVVLVVAVQSH
jgi:hypothetical protein